MTRADSISRRPILDIPAEMAKREEAFRAEIQTFLEGQTGEEARRVVCVTFSVLPMRGRLYRHNQIMWAFVRLRVKANVSIKVKAGK